MTRPHFMTVLVTSIATIGALGLVASAAGYQPITTLGQIIQNSVIGGPRSGKPPRGRTAAELNKTQSAAVPASNDSATTVAQLDSCSDGGKAKTDDIPAPFATTEKDGMYNQPAITVDPDVASNAAAHRFQTINEAIKAAKPGTKIFIQSREQKSPNDPRVATYDALAINGLKGTADHPIKIVNRATGSSRIIIQSNGTGDAISVSQSEYLILEGLELGVAGKPMQNGVLVDHSHCVVLNAMHIVGQSHDNCVDVAGSTGFFILNSTFDNCNGQVNSDALRIVGSSAGVVAKKNQFINLRQGYGVVVNGTSQDILIHGNMFQAIAREAIALGGDTTEPEFVTQVEQKQFEAQDIHVFANIMNRVGANSGANISVFRFAECHDCYVANNTIANSNLHLMQDLNVNFRTKDFFWNNIVLYSGGDLENHYPSGQHIAIYPNLYYRMDNPKASSFPKGSAEYDNAKTISTADVDLIGLNPALADMGKILNVQDIIPLDLHITNQTSDKIYGGGTKVPGLTVDFDGRKYEASPTLGAFECDADTM